MTRITVVVAALVVAGCTATPAASNPPTASIPVASPSSIQVAPSSAEQVLPSDLDPELRRIIDFRRSLGLRHDLAYVVAAATDPAARINFFDFPLYPAEEQAVLADQAAQDVAVHAVEAHAAKHPDEYGGVYIDRDEHPGLVIALWTDHLAEHEAAIRAALGGDSIVAMRKVRYSETYLRSLQDAIVADKEWMEALPAMLMGVGAHISENVVILEVSSAAPDAGERIAAHYGLGDAVRVESDGTGSYFIPWATVKGKVVADDGAPIDEEGLWLDYSTDVPGECGSGDMGFGVGADGHFEFPCQVGKRTIIVMADDAVGDGSREVGRAEVDVTKGTTKVTIRLSLQP